MRDARRTLTAALVALVALSTTAAARPASDAPTEDVTSAYEQAVARVLALPYQPAYVPTGFDDAFGVRDFPAAFPLTDTSTGTCCTGPVPDQPPLADLAPPFAEWPAGFERIELTSIDGTPLHAYVSIVPGAPGVVVMHGFNTNGKYSVARYAAALRANGFSVIAPDHRDMGREWARGGSWHPDGTRHGQTLGWKEAEDLLTAAAALRDRGAPRIGVLGFSEGAQNTILALGRDLDGLIDAALTFSGPADQATLAQRNDASTRALLATVVGQPDLCAYLDTVGQGPEFRAEANHILRQDSAVDTLDGVIGHGVDADVPALHVYAQDDELVPAWNATALASRTRALPLQRTLLVEQGNHAYVYDRWWTQAAALDWFATWLDPEGVTTATPTVVRTPGGAPFGDQLVDLSRTTREDGDAELRDRAFCPAAEREIDPTAVLQLTGDGVTWTADGRRSYVGANGHDLVAWTLDLGDGLPPVTGGDPSEALVRRTFRRSGTYEIVLTVTDDRGRSHTARTTIEVHVPRGHGGR